MPDPDDPQTHRCRASAGDRRCDFASPQVLTERVALAMAAAEGNREAQERAHLNNYDALGYTALANAAVGELRQLGALACEHQTGDSANAAAECWAMDVTRRSTWCHEPKGHDGPHRDLDWVWCDQCPPRRADGDPLT